MDCGNSWFCHGGYQNFYGDKEMNERRAINDEQPRIIPAMSREDEYLLILSMRKMNELYRQQADANNVQNH